MVDFLELSAGQLARILRRADLKVSHEEMVLKGLLKWFNGSKDRVIQFGLLLQNIDFPSLSSSNLAQLKHLSASIGPIGYDLQREIGDALQAHKKRSATTRPDAFRPKRRCLQHWSPELGASSQAPHKVAPYCLSLCWHDGAIYYATCDPPDPSSILRWKPGDTESQAVAGRGARVNGVNDLAVECIVSVSPEGKIFVADRDNDRLLSFENGSGNVVLSDVGVESVFCSPKGAVYVMTGEGGAVERLMGATRHPLISSNDLPAELQFSASDLFVTKDEVIYLSDVDNGRILRMNPGEAEPVVVGEAPNKEISELNSVFVTEEERIYVADFGQQRVWAFHPGDAVWTEVLTCPGKLQPVDLLVQASSLYVTICSFNDESPGADERCGVYEYSLPRKLQLG